VSALSDQDRIKLCGLAINKDEPQRLRDELRDRDEELVSSRIGFTYPPAWDWRNVNGQDWTTPIKDQGSCASGGTFDVVAVMESCLQISKRNNALLPDLSEADLFFCGCGKCCSKGWHTEKALEYAREKGVLDEDCFPYLGQEDQPCTPCADRDSRAVKVKKWLYLATEPEAKEWISRKGPVITAMAIYGDLMHYRSGIYRHVSGAQSGYSEMCVVGYNETERYWICKNSWGTRWGEKGWLRIGYGDCGIGSQFGFYCIELAAE